MVCHVYCAGHLEEYQDPDALDREGDRGETAAYKAARNDDVHKLELLYLACANFDLQASRQQPNLNDLKATVSEQPEGNDAPDQLKLVKCLPAVYNCCRLLALGLSTAICSLEQHPAVSFTGQGIVRMPASVASCFFCLQDLVFRIMLNPTYKRGYRPLPPTPRQSGWACGFKNVTLTSPKGLAASKYCLTLLAEPSRKRAVEPKKQLTRRWLRHAEAPARRRFKKKRLSRHRSTSGENNTFPPARSPLPSAWIGGYSWDLPLSLWSE